MRCMDKKKYYKRLFNYFKKEKMNIFIYFVSSVFLIAINTLLPAISAKNLEAITNTDLENMIKYALILLVLYTINMLVSHLNSRSSTKITNRVEIKIKEDVSKELFDLEIKNFDKEGTGFFANRIESEPRSIAGIFMRFRYSIEDFFTSIGVFIYIFIISPPIGAFLFLSSLINFFIHISRDKKWEKERKESNEMREKYSSNFGELIRGIKDIKVLNLKDYLIKKTIKEQKEIVAYDDKTNKNDQYAYLWIDFLHILMDFFFIVIGVALIKSENLTGANLLVIYMYKSRTNYFMNSIAGIHRTYKDFNLSLERLYELVDDTKYHKEKYGHKSITDAKGSIEFKNVTFGYDENTILKDVSFRIEPCETIGIVGKSGAGKSTIFNLINKLYTVEKGQILLDSIDINELTERSIRGNVTTITQSPYIFNMSIKDNLKIANPFASDEELQEKCKLCALDDYIDSLENGIDTLVGENGVILSGGLKQRLSIARAILKNSKIIMLDEATSSLDNETQDHIHKSIKKIRKDYTVIIIAHRLSTVIDCDKILVVDDGKIVGFDKHENLIKNNKTYQKLYKKELM